MLYTEDISMHHYVGFSQIGSQFRDALNLVYLLCSYLHKLNSNSAVICFWWWLYVVFLILTKITVLLILFYLRYYYNIKQTDVLDSCYGLAPFVAW